MSQEAAADLEESWHSCFLDDTSCEHVQNSNPDSPENLQIKRLVEAANRSIVAVSPLPSTSKESAEAKPQDEYQKLLDMAESPLITNEASFVCLVCFNPVAPGAGVVLYNCLHHLCRGCAVVAATKDADTGLVNCPFADIDWNDEGRCQEFLLEREICALLGSSVHEEDKGDSLPKEEKNCANFAEHLRLIELSEQPAVLNSTPFECPICFLTIAAGDGITLQNCLHSFCLVCAAETIKHAEEPEVKCPCFDATAACEQLFRDSEIRAILSPDDYARYLSLSLRQAEAKIPNTVHCPKPDCPGFCIAPERVERGRKFICSVCECLVCLACLEDHEADETCEEYLQRVVENRNAKTSDEWELEKLVRCGLVIRCPGCQAYVQKTEGCDRVICALCRLEICWVTRLPRRGPNGCHCKENGRKCHPMCRNCH